MVECPNCGSTTKITLIGTDYVTFSHSVEVWRCSCNCVVRRTMKVANQFITYPNGTIERKDG